MIVSIDNPFDILRQDQRDTEVGKCLVYHFQEAVPRCFVSNLIEEWGRYYHFYCSQYATTAAARKGISYDVIRLGAGWTQKSEVFGKFYKRPVRERHTFASLVLDS
nr:unnamed protein product [Callosobruchus analis]